MSDYEIPFQSERVAEIDKTNRPYVLVDPQSDGLVLIDLYDPAGMEDPDQSALGFEVEPEQVATIVSELVANYGGAGRELAVHGLDSQKFPHVMVFDKPGREALAKAIGDYGTFVKPYLATGGVPRDDDYSQISEETLERIIRETEIPISWDAWPRGLSRPIIAENDPDISFTFHDSSGQEYRATINPGDDESHEFGEDFLSWEGDVEQTSRWPHDGDVLDCAFTAAGIVRTRRNELTMRGIDGPLPGELLEVGQTTIEGYGDHFLFLAQNIKQTGIVDLSNTDYRPVLEEAIGHYRGRDDTPAVVGQVVERMEATSIDPAAGPGENLIRSLIIQGQIRRSISTTPPPPPPPATSMGLVF